MHRPTQRNSGPAPVHTGFATCTPSAIAPYLRMTNDMPVSLRPALAEDRFRIRRWLAEPDVAGLVGQRGQRRGRDQPGHGQRGCALPHHRARTARPSAMRRRSRSGCGRRSAPTSWRPAPGTSTLFIGLARAPRPRRSERAALALLAEEVFATTLAVACCGRRVDQERGCRAGLRAGGLPLAADLERPACSARPG